MARADLILDLVRASRLGDEARVRKTVEALADALGVPLFVVRYEAVIGSYLGETAQRIAKVF